MPARDVSEGVKFKTATVQKIFLALMVIFFGMAILGIVGEIFGWWNDVGEVLTIVGTLGGLFVGVATLSTGSSEEQVERVHHAVVENGVRLEGIDAQLDQLEKLDELDAIQLELDKQTGVLDDQLGVLKQVRDGL